MGTTRREFLGRTIALAMLPVTSACEGEGPSTRALDASARDAASVDASTDAASPAVPDATVEDSGSPDASPTDAEADGSTHDAGLDAGAACGSVDDSIDDNHGHTLVVPASDVETGVMAFYTLTANGDHSHGFAVSAADFETLRETGTLRIDSNLSAGHVHAVTLTCVG